MIAFCVSRYRTSYINAGSKTFKYEYKKTKTLITSTFFISYGFLWPTKKCCWSSSCQRKQSKIYLESLTSFYARIFRSIGDGFSSDLYCMYMCTIDIKPVWNNVHLFLFSSIDLNCWIFAVLYREPPWGWDELKWWL